MVWWTVVFRRKPHHPTRTRTEAPQTPLGGDLQDRQIIIPILLQDHPLDRDTKAERTDVPKSRAVQELDAFLEVVGVVGRNVTPDGGLRSGAGSAYARGHARMVSRSGLRSPIIM